MNRIIMRWICLLMIVLSTVACNHDVFIDGSDLPDQMNVSIDSDASQYEVRYSRQGLKSAGLQVDGNEREWVKYYGRNGMPVTPNSPMSDVESIVLESPLCSFSVGLGDGIIYLSCSYNCSVFPKQIVVWLEYEHATKYIHVNIAPGEPLELTEIRYDDGFDAIDEIGRERHALTFNNGSSLVQHVDVWPYRDARISMEVVPEVNWAYGLPVSMPLPVLVGGKWNLSLDYPDVELGRRIVFPFADDQSVVKIDVPPYTSVRITVTVIYSKTEWHGDMAFVNPVTDSYYSTQFKCTTISPGRYEIETDILE